ncbi:MAG: trypsin-like serine protease [Pseudomonadota bacterium]
MPIKALTLAFCLTCASALPAHAQESTGLRGMATENEVLAWQAVGRLDADGRGFCTGTLIAPEFVLTAAHCVYDDRSGALIPAEKLTFRAGLRDGHAASERGISQIEAHPNYSPKARMSEENVRHDVALLRLATPIQTNELDPFVLHNRVITSGPVSVVSYGRGRETVPSRQDVCRVEAAQDDIMLMDCDITFGSSGAPVFSSGVGRGQIVSVISGMVRIDGRKYAVGMALPEVVADLRHRMWANQQKPVAEARRIKIGSGSGRSTTGGAKFVRP